MEVEEKGMPCWSLGLIEADDVRNEKVQNPLGVETTMPMMRESRLHAMFWTCEEKA